MKAGQTINLSISPVDSFNNPAKIDGVPTWVSSDENLLTLNPSIDGLSAVATSVGPVGKVSVTVTADADVSEGIHNLVGVLEIDVEAGEAVDLGTEALGITIPVVKPSAASEVLDTSTEQPVTDSAAESTDDFTDDSVDEPTGEVEEQPAA